MPAPIAILHADADLLAISKPPGLTVHRQARSARGEAFVLQIVSAQVGRFLYPVHRLDRNTSGVLCFAFSSEGARTLHVCLKSPGACKEYLTLVRGETPESFVSERPLTSPSGEQRPARTQFRRLAAFSRCSLLEAGLASGRRHQIRRHLAHLAHQVIGDTHYGKGRINAFFRSEYALPRMFLHARRVVIAHPRTGESLELRDPLAADLREFLLRLPDAPHDLIERL